MLAVTVAPKIQGGPFSSVARLGDTLIVKYGTEVHLWEARNMRLASTIAGVRLPKAYDAWEVQDDEDSVITYIVMDYIPGNVLSDAWTSLDIQAQNGVYRQIHDMLKKLHGYALTRPIHPGPIGGGSCAGYYFTYYGAGPFTSSQEMESWFNDRLQVCKDFRRASKTAPDFSGKFRELVFCHGDLHTHNIILDSTMRVWLIDWAYAGAYPEYFEQGLLEKNLDLIHRDFTAGLLEVISNASHSKDIELLDSVGFALTTGAFCQPSNRP